jgi:hypothetical protein
MRVGFWQPDTPEGMEAALRKKIWLMPIDVMLAEPNGSGVTLNKTWVALQRCWMQSAALVLGPEFSAVHARCG